jgi:ketosteroid isomerase-like protein
VSTASETMPAADRLLALEEIKGVSHRYALGLDRFDLEGIMSAFTEDAVFDATAFGLERVEGSAAIRAFFEHNQSVMKAQMHLYANFIIELDGLDEAHGTNYLFQDGYSNDGAHIHCLGLNEDRYVRGVDGWRIRERVIRPLVAPQLEGY